MQLNCLLSVYVYTFKHGLLSTLVPEASVCIGKQSINRYTAGENADTMRLGLQTKLAICINTLPRRLWEHRGREGEIMSELDYARRTVKCCFLHATWLLYSQTHSSHDCLNKIKGAFFFAYLRYMIQVSLLIEDLWIVHNCCGKG